MDFDPLIAAPWCPKNSIPLLPSDLHQSWQHLADHALPAIHPDPEIPHPEVRLYDQFMKFILHRAAGQRKVADA